MEFSRFPWRCLFTLSGESTSPLFYKDHTGEPRRVSILGDRIGYTLDVVESITPDTLVSEVSYLGSLNLTVQ